MSRKKIKPPREKKRARDFKPMGIPFRDEPRFSLSFTHPILEEEMKRDDPRADDPLDKSLFKHYLTITDDMNGHDATIELSHEEFIELGERFAHQLALCTDPAGYVDFVKAWEQDKGES